MVIEVVPLPLPPSADPTKLAGFGVEVKGVKVASLTDEELGQIQELLYKHDVLLFRNCDLSPEQQYALAKVVELLHGVEAHVFVSLMLSAAAYSVQVFDPMTEHYGHGNNKIGKNSILNPLLTTIPGVPQVQLIGNGTIYNHEGIAEAQLKHPSHKTFHKTHVSAEDEAAGVTRFNRWHMDAALYELSPPKVTALYALRVPQGPPQVCRYDDGTGDELQVPPAATAFVSGKTMFEVLPPELKSVAVRTKVRYAPHPFVWMSTAGAVPTGLGLESDGLEMPYEKLPPWDEASVKTYPVLWKNPVTEALHLQAHPCAVSELIISPLPQGSPRKDALYPDGAYIKDLKTVRDLLYKLQRPGIAPSLVYPHDWRDKDLVVFHNRGVMHSVTGALTSDQVRVYHQCNLAASDEPVGPSDADIKEWA
ncbi:hypothetical protein EWM64_g222 [Hericium alpestre]|uniref:TauD/TfdA-like domain-containing protein n=1 Tax=Hericium alpestre TaxID=135208 RepID=A0A4Z0ABV6_9AGAM|nr:hypothetical protein EWM64_g222 [Hericium alpestre]